MSRQNEASKQRKDVDRKRRSFWEPESDRANEWLDAQYDISVSLQLIITDAINKYGTGDAMRAHLRTLEEGGGTFERAAAKAPPKPKRAKAKKTEPEPVVEPVAAKPAPEPIDDIIPEPVAQKPVTEETAVDFAATSMFGTDTGADPNDPNDPINMMLNSTQ